MSAAPEEVAVGPARPGSLPPAWPLLLAPRVRHPESGPARGAELASPLVGAFGPPLAT